MTIKDALITIFDSIYSYFLKFRISIPFDNEVILDFSLWDIFKTMLFITVAFMAIRYFVKR